MMRRCFLNSEAQEKGLSKQAITNTRVTRQTYINTYIDDMDLVCIGPRIMARMEI